MQRSNPHLPQVLIKCFFLIHYKPGKLIISKFAGEGLINRISIIHRLCQAVPCQVVAGELTS